MIAQKTRAEQYEEWINNGGAVDALMIPRDPGPCFGDDTDDTETELHAPYGPDDATPAPEPYEPGVFGGAHPGDDEADTDALETWIKSARIGIEGADWPFCTAYFDHEGTRCFTALHKTTRVDVYAGDDDTDVIASLDWPKGAADPMGAWLFDQGYLLNPYEEIYPYGPHLYEVPELWYATIPAIGGGSHEADDEAPDMESIRALVNAAWRALYVTSNADTPEAHAFAYQQIDNAFAALSRLRDMVGAVDDPYANLPPIGGGSHEADTTPRTAATTQKRDNQRAERAALNEAYKAHAAGKASEVSDILTAFGFEVASTKDVDGTPVTIWHDTNDHATIKQTPYSLRIYNGQPARLPRHGDAELINRVEHGWCACGEMRGYADGLAHAILRLIEVPDPYMQALDDLEAREAEQSAPTPTPAFQGPDTCSTCGKPFDTHLATVSFCSSCQLAKNDQSDPLYRLALANTPNAYAIAAPGHDGRPVIIAEVEHHDISDRINETQDTYAMPGRYCVNNDAGELVGFRKRADAVAYAGEQARKKGRAEIWTKPFYAVAVACRTSAGDVTLNTFDRYGRELPGDVILAADPLPELVLHGGQPSMSGPWDLPAISGGSQDAETCAECGNTLRPYEQGAGHGTCFACQSARTHALDCQHDADEPPARFCSQCGHDASPDAPQPTAEQIAALKTPTADGNHLSADDPEYGYCLAGCERPATQWVYRHGNYLAYCDECAPCQHDADEPPARFCSQCGHDRSPDAPQPTDTGTSYDVPTKYQTTCPTCDQRLVKTENWQRTCAATWSTPETLHGHISADAAYLVDDYPYGARLRCQIRYWIESGKDGRQRFVSQTCNPKTGRWNNPKKSTYSEVMVMIQDSKGHISYTSLGAWPTECETRRMEALLGEHITEAQASIMRQWRIMQKAQKHITYEIVATPRAYSLMDPDDMAELRDWNAEHPSQTKEEVNAVWNTAINRAVKELETA